MRHTTELPRIEFEVPETFEALFEGGPSVAGWSSISAYLTCPEQVRLRSLGVHRIKRSRDDSFPDELTAAQFGSLIHAVLAIRVAYSPEVASQWLAESEVCKTLHPSDQEYAQKMLRVYEGDYPIDNEPWEYVGCETTVITDLGDGILRSARYDKLVRMKRDHALFSLEHKTTARQGSGSTTSYTAQMVVQQAIWNRNEALVSKYGRMQGVWIDQLVKTQIPKCERLGPHMASKIQQDRMVETLRLVDKMYEVLPDMAGGAWPRFFHSCWGKYGPCEYIGLCHDNLVGDYEQRKRDPE